MPQVLTGSLMAQGSLMVQGTTSDAGKSICVAGLCRVLKRKGLSVAPFKPQNMALNSAVTFDGGEIGRAQALQAVACGLAPRTDFNPVLLKPSSDLRSQVIIQGKVVSELEAQSFTSLKQLAFDQVLESYQRLKQEFDIVLIEGAGSPAEINLRHNDIANMGFAEAVDCPVVLISDIDRGGVFAHLTGTLNLLSASEQQRVKGFIINRFRGHRHLLQGGLDWLEQHTAKPVLGVLPYLTDLRLDAEDAIDVHQTPGQAQFKIKILLLPRISNHTDFDPLRGSEHFDVSYVGKNDSLAGADLVIIPGSKNVRDDLAYLKNHGFDQQIKRHLRYGGKLLGICAGFQMLGRSIEDPLGIESAPGESEGLGLLDFSTRLYPHKQLKQASGQLAFGGLQGAVSGYEIHCGRSEGAALEKPFCQLTDQNLHSYPDGAASDDGQILGTYLHGLFEQAETLQAIIYWLCQNQQLSGKLSVNPENLTVTDWSQVREQQLERLADCFEQHLDLDALLAILTGPR